MSLEWNRYLRLGPVVFGAGIAPELWWTRSKANRPVCHLFNIGIVQLQSGRLLKITVLWFTFGIGVRNRIDTITANGD